MKVALKYLCVLTISLLWFYLQELSRRIFSSLVLSSETVKTHFRSCQTETEKAREILSSLNAVEFMPLEESKDDVPRESRSPKPRKVTKFAWERSKLKNIKAKLDEAYLEGLREKQRRTSACVSRTGEEASTRPPPPANGPCWAVRND